MSRHEGVSCDSCLRSNFRGQRYKCLLCYDYDLCASCYESGATSTRHSSDHPMQCILTQSDFQLFYGGEVLTSEQAQSFTCPLCKKMGFSDAALAEHVAAEHGDGGGVEVVCPVCAASAGGEPNLVTEDLGGHLSLEHRSGGPRGDLISFLDEPAAIRHGGLRRIPHSGRILGGGGPRSRRANMHFSATTAGGLSPQGRESVDLIAELQQQLNGGGARRQYSQMQQQLQMQIHNRQTNIPLRQHSGGASSINPPITPMQSILSVMSSARDASFLSSAVSSASNSNGTAPNSYLTLNASASSGTAVTTINVSGNTGNASANPPGLLARTLVPPMDDAELAKSERQRHEVSEFLHNLILASLQVPISNNEETVEETEQPQPQQLQQQQQQSEEEPDTTNQQTQSQPQTQQQSQPPPPSQQNKKESSNEGGGAAVPHKNDQIKSQNKPSKVNKARDNTKNTSTGQASAQANPAKL